MLQVAIDAGPLHGRRTGVGNAVAWTIEALASRAPDHDSVELLKYITSMRSKPAPDERRLPLPAAVAQRLWSRRFAPPMDRWLGRTDVVHGTNYVVPPARAPRLVSVYDCWFLDHPDQAVGDVVRAGAVLRRSVRDGAHVVTSSHATADRVRELLDTTAVTTVHLGPPPFDPDAPRTIAPLGDPDTPFVLALGTVERRKNLPLLVSAFERVAAEHPTITLRIAGRPGDDMPALSRALGRLRSSTRSRVVVHGGVDAATKRWLLAHAVALAYPSLDEGFGFPVLEAQLAGTPVVASSAGSIPEIAGTGALLSTPRDIRALAANLFWVVANDDKRRELIERGHRNVERFSWTRTADDLTALYRRLAREA